MSAGPEYAPSLPKPRSDTPPVPTQEALTAATPSFLSGEVTPGFAPFPAQSTDVCPACLAPVVSEGTGPACRWPVCGHATHAPAFGTDLEAMCGQLDIDWHALPVPVQFLPPAGSVAVAATAPAVVAASDALGRPAVVDSGAFVSPALLSL